MTPNFPPENEAATDADREAARVEIASLPLVKVVPLERYLSRRPGGRSFSSDFLTQKAAEDYLILRLLLPHATRGREVPAPWP